MRAKEFLKQLEKIDKLITNKTIELDRWKAIATGTGCQFGSERVQTGINKDKRRMQYADMWILKTKSTQA